MSVLRDWVERECRVKVFIRGVKRIRGFATGFLLAYDKHWNLCLADVDEEFRRQRQRKATPTIEERFEEDLHLVQKQKQKPGKHSKKIEQVGNSHVHIVTTRRKTETCRRHVAQLVLRGEHVVSVAKMP